MRCSKGHPYSDAIHQACPACARGDTPVDFDGATYERKHDLVRLTGQIKRVYNLMRDGHWRTVEEIADATEDPQTSISAQLRNLRKKKFGQHIVSRRHRGGRKSGIYEYQVVVMGVNDEQ